MVVETFDDVILAQLKGYCFVSRAHANLKLESLVLECTTVPSLVSLISSYPPSASHMQGQGEVNHNGPLG